ncbi:MAG: hypothetical protein HYX61_11075 [Gammaproteobacteria bacterium]|jgi:hypothetical protein|nr:hypothetical protein [Gammaproteobacteria bacterium]
MAYNGPIASSSESSSTDKPFQLRSYETDPFIFQAITKLPLEETLKELEELPPHISKIISHAIENIYSHVTQRIPDENSDHFFHHPASTVYYETHHRTLIKGKDHTKKASSLVKMVEQTILEIETRLKQQLINPRQVEILTNFRNIFKVHQAAFNKALLQASPTKKAHLKKHQNHDVENAPQIPISPSKMQSISKSYPAPTSPSKGQLTPTKLSDSDKRSIDYLRSLNPKPLVKPMKKLVFDSPSQEGSDFEDSEESKDSQDSKDFEAYFSDDFERSDDSSDSLDNFLSQGINTLLFRPNNFGRPCTSTSASTSMEKVKKSNHKRYL